MTQGHVLRVVTFVSADAEHPALPGIPLRHVEDDLWRTVEPLRTGMSLGGR